MERSRPLVTTRSSAPFASTSPTARAVGSIRPDTGAALRSSHRRDESEEPENEERELLHGVILLRSPNKAVTAW
jgi:hypothetical protein